MSRALCLPAIFALLLTSALLAPDPQSAALARVQSASSGSPTLRFVVVGDTQDDGSTGFCYSTRHGMSFQPCLAAGSVYAGTNHGGLVCLETGGDDASGWHMWGGNAQHNKTV